jgi:hypothetical protein
MKFLKERLIKINSDEHRLALFSEVSEKLDTSPQVLMKNYNNQSKYGKTRLNKKNTVGWSFINCLIL